MNPGAIQRLRYDRRNRRDCADRKWNPQDYPHRNALLGGLSVLSGLITMDHRHFSLWSKAYHRDEKKLIRIVNEVIASPTPENEVPGVILDRVVMAFDLERAAVPGEVAS